MSIPLRYGTTDKSMQEIKITESVNSSQVRYNTTILKLRKILSITMMMCQFLLDTVQQKFRKGGILYEYKCVNSS